MTVEFQRVCVYGAGAIGGWIATRLARAGCTLSAVARGDTLAALQTHGLRLDQGGETLTAPVHAVADPAELGVQDLVLVAVKGPALAGIAERLQPLLGPNTVVLTAMNGVPWWFFQGFGGAYAGRSLESVDPGARIAQAIPAAAVLGCVVHASCALHSPGFVRHHHGNQLIIGEPAGGISERVQTLVALLNRAGIEAKGSEQVQKDCWYKLWGNMTVNPISAITGATSDKIMDDDLVRGFITQVMLEAKEIGARIGIPIDQRPEDRHAITRRLGAFKSSMLQDVEAGRPIELDALVSVVRELGQMTQTPTPFTDALLGLTRLHARVRGLYGS
jgi:2-dehydropantoate 2-reductase